MSCTSRSSTLNGPTSAGPRRSPNSVLTMPVHQPCVCRDASMQRGTLAQVARFEGFILERDLRQVIRKPHHTHHFGLAVPQSKQALLSFLTSSLAKRVSLSRTGSCDAMMAKGLKAAEADVRGSRLCAAVGDFADCPDSLCGRGGSPLAGE